MKDIEDFLRETKPQVKNDPTFILEAQNRMEQVEGIKAEVDRQRHHGRVALIVALCAGLAIGVVASAIAFFYPVDAQSATEGILQSIRLFLQNYRQYLLLSVALIAIVLGVVLSRGSSSSVRL